MCKDLEFSIIIPIYNVEKYLAECLQSVLEQTYSNFEAICVYDKSTDNTFDVLNRFSVLDKRIKIVISSEKKGLSNARNIGMENANGKYILFLDSDDMLDVNALQVIHNEFYEGLDMIYFGAKIREEKNGEIVFQDYCNHGELGTVCNGREMIVRMVSIGDMRMAAWLQCWKKASYEKYGLQFKIGILHEDNLFTYLGCMKAQKTRGINDKLYIYRKRDDSLTQQEQSERCLQSWVTIYKEIIKYWERNHSLGVDFATIQFLREVEPNMYYCYRDVQKIKNDVIKLDSFDGYILETIVSRYKWIETSPISPDLVECLKSEKKIYIFGAKRIARQQAECLRENGIEIEAFIISNKEENCEKISETQVLEINDEKVDKNSLVIVGARRQLWTEVITTLQSSGYCRICTFNGIGYIRGEE